MLIVKRFADCPACNRNLADCVGMGQYDLRKCDVMQALTWIRSGDTKTVLFGGRRLSMHGSN